MEKLIAYVLGTAGLNALVVRYHKTRLLAALRDMRRFGTATAMPTRYSQRFQHHHCALRRLGFVVEREFALQRRTIFSPECYHAFHQSLRVRFPDGLWSCSASGKRVIVTAPPGQMPEWQIFLTEYDHAD